MGYLATKPNVTRSIEELRATIPGWGVDLDPSVRPGVPKERFALERTGAHWEFPERQPVHGFREKSTEHKFLTPVFGTACPLKGLSGVLRRIAYKFSEGQSAHWLLLVLADRVDVVESSIVAVFRGKPDNPFAERGLKAEITRHGIRSRFGRNRGDLKNLPVDVALFAASGAAVMLGLFAVGKAASAGIARLR